MEPDMASAMFRNLQTHGYEVNILHGDSDSTTMARIRPEFKDLQKKNDKNHFKKNLFKDFYKLWCDPNLQSVCFTRRTCQ